MDRSPGKGAAPKHGTFSAFKAVVDVDERLDAGAKAEAVVMVVRRRMVDNIIMVVVLLLAGGQGGWTVVRFFRSAPSKDTATHVSRET